MRKSSPNLKIPEVTVEWYTSELVSSTVLSSHVASSIVSLLLDWGGIGVAWVRDKNVV